MNFFGHAVVASRRGASPALALGAMLPDFASMCRGGIARVTHAEVEAGVALHHRTDAAFHRLTGFLSLCRQTAAQLQQRGLGRGPARGAAHVAVELLLDGVLLDDDTACRLYTDALAGDWAHGIHWHTPDQAARWHGLHARLRDHGLPVRYRDPEAVAESVARVLDHRPLLRLGAADQERVRAAMAPLQVQVAARAGALMDELAARMAAG